MCSIMNIWRFSTTDSINNVQNNKKQIVNQMQSKANNMQDFTQNIELTQIMRNILKTSLILFNKVVSIKLAKIVITLAMMIVV